MAPSRDVSQFIGKQTEELFPFSYGKRDLLVYAVAIGCDEEKFTYELNYEFQMFPTFPVSLFCYPTEDLLKMSKHPLVRYLGLPAGFNAKEYGVRTGVDGEQYAECVRPMPAEGGEFIFRNVRNALIRKGGGKGISSEIRSTIEDKQGNVYYKFWGSLYAIGQIAEFDDAGESGAITVEPPARAPDAVERFRTSPLQALMYRLAGDLNNIHVDKTVAKNLNYVDGEGNGKPILQGKGSLGIGTRAVLKAFGKNDAKAFHCVSCRFSAKVLPGQTLETRMWLEGAGNVPGTKRVVFSTVCVETRETVLSNAYMDLHEAHMGPEDTSKDTWRAGTPVAKF